MKHEILRLNSSRTYLLVNEVWYDTHVDLNPRVGQNFLNGQVKKILSYEDYIEKFPESKKEMHEYVTEKTISKGFIRRVINGLVKYAVNPATPQIANHTEREPLMD